MNRTQGKRKIIKQCQEVLKERGTISSFYSTKIEEEDNGDYYVAFYLGDKLVFEVSTIVDDSYKVIQYNLSIQ